MSDRAAVHDLLTTFMSYYATNPSIPLEWEFRFSSFRVYNARFAHDYRIMYDEYASVGALLQKFGWRLDGKAQHLKRWIIQTPFITNSNNSGVTGTTRITEVKNTLAMEYKTPYLASKTSAMKELSDTYHIRASLQQEKMEKGLTQHDIRTKRDAAVHDGTASLRDITRTSFIHPDFPSMRIDFSDILTKQSTNSVSTNTSSLSSSSGKARLYEIELEILPDKVRLLSSAKIIDAIRQIIMGLQFGKHGIVSGPRWKATTIALNDVLGFAQIRFPQPISISKLHLSSIIQGEFAVTEKADGKRCLLFLSGAEQQKRELFRVDFYGRLISIGLSLDETLHSTFLSFLLDAEFIEETNTYLIFDIYLYEGTTDWLPLSSVKSASPSMYSNSETTGRIMFHSALLVERYNVLNAILTKCTNSWIGKGKETTHLQLKNMIFPSGQTAKDNRALFEFIHNVNHKVVKFPYKVEGLLFTHTKATLPINATSSSSFHLPINTTITATRWNGAVKHKSPEETTNDFQLGAFEWDEDSKSLFIPLYCYVSSTGQLAPFEGILPNDPFGQKHTFLRFENQQSLSRREVSAESFVFELGNLQLFPGAIVECFFDLQQARWIPIRCRPDKCFPNSVDVVYANWELIHSPLNLPTSVEEAEEMMKLQSEIEDPEFTSATTTSILLPTAPPCAITKTVYYRESSSADENTKALREFNNYIKRIALRTCIDKTPARQQGRKLQVLDFAIGRGGDLKKYFMESQTIGRVLGIDLSDANLELCHRRFSQINLSGPEILSSGSGFTLDLLHGSASWSLENSSQWMKHSKYLYCSQPTAGSSSALQSQLSTVLPQKHSMDIATLHFALHYFWKSEDELDRLLSNIQFVLPVGGFFLATCYDGQEVHDFFLRNDALTLHDKSSGEIYLQVRPKYDRAKHPTFLANDDPENIFGLEIEIFNKSINEETMMSEWLVHPAVLQKKMELLGFRMIPLHEFFGKQCPEFIKPLLRTDHLFWHMYLKWKRHGIPPVIPPEQLSTACGWNRLFVFQRMDMGPIGDSSLYSLQTHTSTSFFSTAVGSGGEINNQPRMLHKHTRMPNNQSAVKFSNLVHLHPSNYYGLTLPLQDAKQTLFRR